MIYVFTNTIGLKSLLIGEGFGKITVPKTYEGIFSIYKHRSSHIYVDGSFEPLTTLISKEDIGEKGIINSIRTGLKLGRFNPKDEKILNSIFNVKEIQIAKSGRICHLFDINIDMIKKPKRLHLVNDLLSVYYSNTDIIIRCFDLESVQLADLRKLVQEVEIKILGE